MYCVSLEYLTDVSVRDYISFNRRAEHSDELSPNSDHCFWKMEPRGSILETGSP